MDKLTLDEYREAFRVGKENTVLQRRALQQALDIRKFEIELYWKRATYFWAFIAAAFAAFGAIQTAARIGDIYREHLSVAVGAFGFVFSFGWFCVNSGSKRWQENWENHVDFLENEVIGPLYKTILSRRSLSESLKTCGGNLERLSLIVTWPAKFSVSKVNQIISLFVTALWIPIVATVLQPLSASASPDWFVIIVIGFALFTCILIAISGRTHANDYEIIAVRKKPNVVNAKSTS